MRVVSFCICFLFAVQLNGQTNFCGIKNSTTQNGEEITYTIYYALAGAHVNAGSTTFSNKLEKLNGRTVYHTVGVGGSNVKYDWIYKVRDRYESYIDTATMQPLKFFRHIRPGRALRQWHKTFSLLQIPGVSGSRYRNFQGP